MSDHTTPTGGESLLQRLPILLLYFVLGALVGVMGSFTHRSRADIFDITVWYGIVVALACVVAFGYGLRTYARRSTVSYAFAVGLIVGIGFIAIGISHSVVIVGDLVGLIWLAAAPLIALGFALWPQPREPRTSETDAAGTTHPPHPDAHAHLPHLAQPHVAQHPHAQPHALSGEYASPGAHPVHGAPTTRGYPGNSALSAHVSAEEPKQ